MRPHGRLLWADGTVGECCVGMGGVCCRVIAEGFRVERIKDV